MPESKMPTVGAEAPGIVANTATGEPFDLSAHRGSWVVVYFFPRSNTPG